MGMIVTLYLISTNVYNSLDAPSQRGFSYVELWMIGSQFPILLALLEYGVVLYLKKVDYKTKDEKQSMEGDDLKSNIDEKIKTVDIATMIVSFCLFVTFALGYWISLK